MTVAAVIVAGGSGLRAGGERPKQYQLIGGKPVIWWTLSAFASHPQIEIVQTVIGTGHEEWFRAATKGLAIAPPVIGGATRQESCRLGLEALAGIGPVKVLIHDAARPFVTHGLISDMIAALDLNPCVIPGLPVAETLKHAPGGIVGKTVDRTSMWTAQTPQGFVYDTILAAHRKVFEAGVATLTDDAAVAEYLGLTVGVIPGPLGNVKITTSADLDQAEKSIASRLPDIRVGQGIDFHAFEKGDAIIICGVRIPHNRKLKGHSDADAAMHALTDAILGAIGEGDIGTHFPPSDPQWKGAASSIFLEKALNLLAAKGGAIANADITILAEAPKIGPHIPAMKSMLSRLMNLDPARIAIKATTT
jgi:2-C-methyl-D-erythritol 4-phosphate cytidylyltransferase / 2-C-methyl-D-erythritol 2,4-cyclodiphosphate synthase